MRPKIYLQSVKVASYKLAEISARHEGEGQFDFRLDIWKRLDRDKLYFCELWQVDYWLPESAHPVGEFYDNPKEGNRSLERMAVIANDLGSLVNNISGSSEEEVVKLALSELKRVFEQ